MNKEKNYTKQAVKKLRNSLIGNSIKPVKINMPIKMNKSLKQFLKENGFSLNSKTKIMCDDKFENSAAKYLNDFVRKNIVATDDVLLVIKKPSGKK